MSDDEIRISYKLSLFKYEQVQILADLNVCTRAEMEDKLISLGLAIPRRRPCGRKNYEEAYREYYRDHGCAGV